MLGKLKVVVCLGLVLALVGCGREAPKASAENSAVTAPSFTAFVKLDAPNVTPPTSECDESCLKLRQELRYVVYVGKQIYCYWDEKRADSGADFDELATQLELSITSKTTPTEYYLALRTWASAFRDGHVNVMMKADRSDIEIYSAPVRLEVLAPATEREKIIVVEAKPETELKVGDEVTAIDGVPIKTALDRAVTQVSGSTARMRRFFATRRLVDVLGASRGAQPLALTVKREATVLSVELERNVELATRNGAGAEKESTGADLIKAAILPGGLGYLRIDGFQGSQDTFLLNQAMERLSATKGLLIDLRKNGGGDQSGNAIIAHLIKSPVTRYRTSERMTDFLLANRPELTFLKWTPGTPYADWHDLTVKPQASPLYNDKPVVALVGPNCFSACDTFTAGLKANGLATIVGEGTGGGTGSPLVFPLPLSGHNFRYSVVRGLTARDEAIESAGTLPEVVIEPASADRAAGKDRQLLKAIEILGGKSGVAKLPSLAASHIVASWSKVWTQGLERSPTLSDEIRLEAVAKCDEAATAQ